MAQTLRQTVTLVHQNGTLVLESIQVGFVNDRGEIHHSYIDSLHVDQPDSVRFAGGIPELQELHGTPVTMNINLHSNRIIVEPHTPGFYAIFSSYHTLYAIDCYKARFGNLLNFKKKEQYRELKLYLGDAARGGADQPAWFDFFYALLHTDQQLYGGRHEAMIRKAFKSAGYHIQWIHSP